MKIKISELIGAALDWAVAKIVQEWNDEDRWFNTIGYIDSGDPEDEPYQPSTNWNQGGKLIDEHKISINYDASGRWSDGWRAFSVSAPVLLGPTALVAAMRSLVASKFSDEIEIPDGFSLETSSREIRAPKDEADWIAMHNEQIVYCPEDSNKEYTKGDFIKLCGGAEYKRLLGGDERGAFDLYQYCLPHHLPEDIIAAAIKDIDGGNNKGDCKHTGINTNCCPCGDHP